MISHDSWKTNPPDDDNNPQNENECLECGKTFSNTRNNNTNHCLQCLMDWIGDDYE